MGFLDFFKPLVEAATKLFPYRRTESKIEIEIRLSDSPPCHQREIRNRHPLMVWHSRVYGSHVDGAGKFQTWQIK